MTTQTLSLRKASSIALPRVNLRVLLFFSICVALFLSVLYIFQINSMIAGGYIVKSYQKQVEVLAQETRYIELSLSEGDNLDAIKAKTRDLGFQRVATIRYIQVLDASLAKR